MNAYGRFPFVVLIALTMSISFTPAFAQQNQCPTDQNCNCTSNLTASGPNAQGVVHFEATISGGCRRGASFPNNFPEPWHSIFYQNVTFNDGVMVPSNIDTTCWAPGEYWVEMQTSCGYSISGSSCNHPLDPPPVIHKAFTVEPRTPSVSIAFEEATNRLRITYDYALGGDTAGEMDLYTNGSFSSHLTPSIAACGQPSGTCYVDVTPSCTIKEHFVKIRSCGGDSWKTSNKEKILANSTACPVPKDSTNCQPCPTCSPAPDPCVGKPIHVGSGDVSASVPLFTIEQPPQPLTFDLTYHSLAPAYPSAISTTLGSGWTHSFNMTLRQADAVNVPGLLLLVMPRGERYYFYKATDTLWLAAKPRASSDRVVTDGTQSVLSRPDGSEVRFDTASGRWLSTRDRWGNTTTGTYTNGLLTTITNMIGRQVTLSYTGGALSSVQLPSGETWQFTYANGELSAIRDPITGSNWRTFEYTTDSHGVARLLTAVRDTGGKLLEGHTYDSTDRGITSVAEGNRQSLTVEYNTPAAGQSRVTESIDGTATRVSTFTLVQQNGQYLVGQLSGMCMTCGGGSEQQNYTYDRVDQVTTATDGSGHVTAYSYDAFGNVVLKREAFGTPIERFTFFGYDNESWPSFMTSKVEPSATGNGLKTTTYTWSNNETVLTSVETGRLNASDAPVSYTTTTTFDSRHRMLTFDGTRLPADVDDTTTYVWYADDDSRINARGRLFTITDAMHLTTTFEDYDGFGTSRWVTDLNNVVTQRQTDARGRIISSTSRAVPGDPNETIDYTTTYSFDARDRLAEVTRPRGQKTRYSYEDGTNLVTDLTLVDFDGLERERRHLVHDVAGQKTNEEDQLCTAPAQTCSSWSVKRNDAFTYDSFGRLHQVVHGATSVDYAYAADGLLQSVKDENHDSANTSYGYDALHRLASVSQTLAAGSIVTLYGYDRQDNLAQVTDPNGNITTYAYDDFHRLQKQVSLVTGTTTYTYDPANNLVSTTDANNITTTRTYDADNRLKTSVSTSATANESISYTFDATPFYAVGRIASMTDPTGTTSYIYDRRGLLLTESRTINGSAYTTSYGYDKAGNRSSVTYPSGRVVTYGFDFANRPVSASSGPTNFVWSASYLPFGPPSSITYGNGWTKSMTYDDRYRITENKLTFGASGVADYLYGHDANGNITQIHDAIDPSFNRDFGYDDLNRLITANTGTSLWRSGSYAYDAMGNIRSRTLGVAPDVGGEFSQPGRPRATTAAVSGYVDRLIFTYQGTTPKIASVTTVNAPPGDGSVLSLRRPTAMGAAQELSHSVTYDAAGNETQYYVSRVYSPRNLLASVIDTSGEESTHRIDYGYDGRGVRVARAESPAGNGSANRHYFYTPDLQLLEITLDDAANVWSQRARVAAAPLGSNHEFVWFGGQPVAEIGPPRTVVDNTTLSLGRRTATPLAATDIFYTFTDHLGTPLLQFTPGGQVVWRAEHEPYGNVWLMRAGARTDQPLRLPGQDLAMTWEGAEESYNIFRWYSSSWGRYTQPDPIGQRRSLNLFTYADDNSLGAIDPLGLVTLTVNPLKPNIVSQDTLRKTVFPSGIGGQDLKGATFAARKVTCTCSCSNGWYRPKISIDVAYQIWVGTSSAPGWPSVTQIIYEEEKHVHELDESTKTLVGIATKMENHNYMYKTLCQLDCFGLEIESAFSKWLPGFLENVPGMNPHPY